MFSSLCSFFLQSAGKIRSCWLRELAPQEMSRVNNPPSPTSIYSRNQETFESHDHFQPPRYHPDPPSLNPIQQCQNEDQEWSDYSDRRGLTSRFSSHEQPSGTNMRNDRLAMRRDSEGAWNSRAAPIENGSIRRVQLSRHGHFIQVSNLPFSYERELKVGCRFVMLLWSSQLEL